MITMEVFIDLLKKQKDIVPERDFPAGVYTYTDGTIFVYHPNAEFHMLWSGKIWMGPTLNKNPPWIFNIGPMPIDKLDKEVKELLIQFTSCARDDYLSQLWINVIKNV